MTAAPSVPPEIKGFKYVRPIASGGFSDVYLYDQILPRRKVAIKVLRTDDLSPGLTTAFTSEANVMAVLSGHPNIVTIHQAALSASGQPYLVMEYCSGPTLSARYKSSPLSIAEALTVGVQLAGALATTHAAGVLHRDVKPPNVLTNDYGRPALTDFGLGGTPETDGRTVSEWSLELTIYEGSVGISIPWAPPEMFQDEVVVGPRTDIYSLAATIYSSIAGRTPFEVPGKSNGSLDLMGRIERGSITPFDRTDVPTSVTAVLRKGMATAAADRYATAVEFGRALQRIEIELGLPPTPMDLPSIDALRKPKWRKTATVYDYDEFFGTTVVFERPPNSPPPPPPPVPVPQSRKPAQAPAEAVVPTAKAAQAPAEPAAAVAKPDGTRIGLPDDLPQSARDRIARVLGRAAMQTPAPPRVMRTWKLALPSEGRLVAVSGTTVLGRDPVAPSSNPDASLVPIIDTDATLSKTHALLTLEGDDLWVHDLGSTNGVYVVGPGSSVVTVEPRGRVQIPDGAELELGSYVIPIFRS